MVPDTIRQAGSNHDPPPLRLSYKPSSVLWLGERTHVIGRCGHGLSTGVSLRTAKRLDQKIPIDGDTLSGYLEHVVELAQGVWSLSQKTNDLSNAPSRVTF